MLSFLRRNQVLFSAFLSVLVSLYIIAPAAKGQHRSDPIGPLLIAVMRPLQSGIQASVIGIREFFMNYAALRGVATENDRLKTRVRELEGEKSRLLEEEATNKRLRELMEFRSEWAPKSMTASVIANSASAYFHSLIIDKGKNDGVERGMAVISALGVVGQVVAVTSRNAKVLLVTDPHSGVDAMDQRSRGRGIVSGSLENGPVMKYVKRSEDLKEGDRLVTSGLDGVFPKGLMIGTISKVNKKSVGLFQYIEVSLAVDPERVEEVLVVRGVPPEIKD
ncbi:MAG TPA: rod shape-determining protein MreC [Verrucomicrobiae bacterium]|jgi:rod shape-determining protein MreC|nr:rod shape-determining protein MreC [Verrucomicrobiae bacterium]